MAKSKKRLKTKVQTQKVPSKGGQPTKFTPVLALRILKRIKNGETLRSICRDSDMPHFDTVYEWQNKLKEFSDAFAYAREIGTHNLADECMEIADRPGLDPQDRRIMIDTRLKLIGLWNRRDYGDKREVQMTGVSLGELIEASYARLEERRQDPLMLDVTPEAAPASDKLIARTADKEMVRTQTGEVVVRRRAVS